jgi:pyridoxal phosphate enzyme (YggS family)
MIKNNVNTVLENIRVAALRVGRTPGDVTLIGVTKFADVPAINEAIASGLSHIAENKVQQAKEKFPKLETAGKPVTKHMIGHLQTNKVKDALDIFDLIHSVDSRKLVDEIQKRAAGAGKVADILVQVDIAKEETKFGLAEEELDGLIAHLAECSNIRTLGLMTMAPLVGDEAVIRNVFRRCREHFEHFRSTYPSSERIQMTHLSMGMSQDYVPAIEEGATMVRVGSAIFKES